MAAGNESLDVIDFKTDAPSEGPVQRDSPQYTAQVGTYRQLLAGVGAQSGPPIRCGLLFTADGVIRWF